MSGAALSPSARALRKVVLDLVLVAIVGLVLALLGPFGSFAMPFATRLLYWEVLIVAGYACYAPVAILAERWGTRLDLPRPLLWGIACMIATVPMALIVAGLDSWSRGRPMPGLEDFSVYYVRVLVIGVAVTAVGRLVDSHRNRPPAPPVPTGEGASPRPIRFLERLSPALGSDLLALEMEDHYVRAHTALGSELVLLRLGDAIAELDGLAGERVHRSWWVARDAVEDVRREGRNIRLVLPRGIEAPVARSNAAALRAAGWF